MRLSGPKTAVAFAVVFASLQSVAHAQNRWTIHIDAGASALANPGFGSSAIPPAGDPFSFIPDHSSRAVSSWFFGAGAELLNQVNAQEQFSPASVVPLDAALGRSGLRGGMSPALGVRLTRQLTPRFAVETALSFHFGGFEVTKELRQAVDASIASFRAVWGELPSSVNTGHASVFTDVDFTGNEGRRLLTTAALRINLAGTQGRSLYAIAGGGIRSTFGQDARITIEGNYDVRRSGDRWAEHDFVTLDFDVDRYVAVAVVGGGWEQPISRKAGLSLEIRSHLGSTGASTKLTAAPQRQLTGRAVVLVTGQNPSIYMSNLSQVPSSLSQPVSGFVTYEDGGVRAHTSISAGLFFRF